MSDESPEETTALPTSESTGKLSREDVITRILIGIGLVDQALLAKVRELSQTDQLGSLLSQLVESGKLSAVQIEQVEKFSEVVLADLETAGGSISDTLSIAQNRSAFQDTVSGGVEFRPRDRSTSGTFGDYEILSEIAVGGMGVVYKARQTKLNRIVALKMIRSADLANKEQVERFYTEAEAAAKLNHPSIVPVYDVGEANGQHYFSMAFVDGESLQDRVKRDGPLLPKEAAKWIRDAAEAVHHAHESDIVHRDIKPQNILLDQHGRVQVTDFGLAKLQQSGAELTADGQVLGTPAYMPPEQASGRMEQVGVQADVYSLGATLYFLLTGRPPFQASTVADTLRQVLDNEPVLPRTLNPSIPRDLETICLKALRKEAEHRYATSRGLADDLQNWIDDKPIVARPVGKVEKIWKWCRRRPAIVALKLVILVLIVVGTAVSWERQTAIHADGLVDRLMSAETRAVPEIIDEMAGYRSRVKEKLQRKLHESDRGSTAELHAALALLPTDATQVELLGDRLLWVEPERFATVRDLLEPHRTDLTEKYWRLATAPDQDPDQRFHAACALATFDSRHDHWQDMDFRRFVAEHLVGVRPSVLAVWRAALRPVKQYLVDPLSAIYRDPSRGEQLRSFATDSLSEFAAQDPDTLFELLAESEQDQFSVMYERLMEHREPAIRLATAELARTVADSWTEEEKDAFARRQANAAAALFKLGAPDALWPLLAHRPDPRVRSYIVHWLSRLGGKPLTLWKRFEQEADPTIRRALLLCLGGFEPSQLSPAERASIIPRLLEIYRDEPDAGLHGAAEWLLRVWGQATRLADIDQELKLDELQLGESQNRQRQWYINTQGQTFVILEADEFLMGAPDSELDRQPEEIQHRRRVGRRFAISSKEVTREQYRRFQVATGVEDLADNPSLAPVMTTEDSPQLAMTWYEAAQYCNWLSEQEGIPGEQWCYTPNEQGVYGPGMKAKDDHLQLQGYRLPTGPEYEFSCRAGASTSRYYGMSATLLGKYAWYQDVSQTRSHPVGSLMPNDFGLFDMLGNAYEWCDNLFLEYEPAADSAVEDAPHTTPLAPEDRLVIRGGAFFTLPIGLRSAVRSDSPPGQRANDVGFRPVRTLP